MKSAGTILIGLPRSKVTSTPKPYALPTAAIAIARPLSHAFIFHELIGVRKEFWVPLKFAGISITEERRSGVIQACLASPGFHRRGCERS
jgi:hypothetical protein